MRFLADANVPHTLTIRLRTMGHDVEEVLVWNPNADDPSVLERAKEQNRILITADLWFGNTRIHPVGSYPGMIIVHPKRIAPEEVAILEAQAIESYSESLLGKLAIVDKNQMRIREPH